MKRCQRQMCATCNKDEVAHYDGEPHGTHVKSQRHQDALHAADSPSLDTRGHPATLGAIGGHAEVRAS